MATLHDIFTAIGVGAKVELEENRIRISRKGPGAFFLHGLAGEKEILISQISSIQFKRAGTLTNGYIQFGFLGGQESKAGIFAATKDENSVMFKQQQQSTFEELKNRIDRIRDADQQAPIVQSSPADEIDKLASLKERGIITQEEFDRKKKQLLGL